jgi:hypothetical protein
MSWVEDDTTSIRGDIFIVTRNDCQAGPEFSPCERASGKLRWWRDLLGVALLASNESAADLGDTSAVLEERKDDVDGPRETVGSSFGPVVLLLDVRRVSTDDVNLFADVLDDLRDRPPQSSPVLDQLREDVGRFSDHVKKLRADVKELRDPVNELRDHVKELRDDVEKSSHCVKESSQRRLRPKSSRSGLRS